MAVLVHKNNPKFIMDPRFVEFDAGEIHFACMGEQKVAITRDNNVKT